MTLVCGPPCAGKNYYVEQRRKPGDTVLDQDAVGATAYRAAIDELRGGRPPGDVWVIRCLGGASRRADFAKQIQADRVVLLDLPDSVLVERAQQRTEPHRHLAAIKYWRTQEDRDPGGDPAPRPVTRW